MQDFLSEIVKAVFEAGRVYLRATPSPLDDFFIPVLNTVEKFILDKLVPSPALQATVGALMTARGMSAPQ